MLNQDVWDGYEQRMKLLNPFFSFGKGMDVGLVIKPYIENILIAALLELFYREVRNDESRTENDIKNIISEVVEEMDIDADDESIERLVTGILYLNPNTLEPYEKPYFSHAKGSFFTQTFKYLVADMDSMDDTSDIIYKLTDDSQFILFSSREITAELSISLEQLYMIQLLNKGNIDGILKQTDFLLQRVRNLTNKEKEYSRTIARNPKIILQDSFDDKSQRHQEIKKQFQEEDENFKQMYKLLYRLEEKNDSLYDTEAQEKIKEIRERLRQTTEKHSEFNTLVTSNISFIIDIRTNRPDLLVSSSALRFREDYWESLIYKEGITSEEIAMHTLTPLFSPIAPTLFSMDRMWEEQRITKRTAEEPEDTKDTNTFVPKPFYYEIQWDNILGNWIPIVQELLKHGYYSLDSLSSMKGWSKDAIEMWVQLSKETFTVPTNIDLEARYTDEREDFIRRLILKKPDLRMLQGCTLYVDKHFSKTITFDDAVTVTTGTLCLKSPTKEEAEWSKQT